ncbi:MAG: fibronectin type III domain-containing protein [Elusimicrobia bacterium]|nr:fibronectin type III domain-containing protein [Elusimicrobiota bacterium]
MSIGRRAARRYCLAAAVFLGSAPAGAARAQQLPDGWSASDGGAALNADASASASFARFSECGNMGLALWQEAGRVRAAAYNGNDASPAWNFADNGGLNKDSARQAGSPALACLDNRLYAAWHEHNGSAWQVRVAAFDGNSWSWADGGTAFGINRNPGMNALDPGLAVLEGRLYAVWRESDGSVRRIRAAVRVPSGLWLGADGGALSAPGLDSLAPQLETFSGRLYAAWQESDGQARRIRAAVYGGNDASPSWSAADGGGMPSDPGFQAFSPSLCASSASLYAAWEEVSSGERRVRIAAYAAGQTPAWRLLDGEGLNRAAGRQVADPDKWISHAQPRLRIYNDRLYAAFQQYDGLVRRVRVAAYEAAAGAWSYADGGALLCEAARAGAHPALGLYRDGLYAVWAEAQGNSSRVRVSRARHFPADVQAASVSDTVILLSWRSVGAALGYRLDLSTAADFSGELRLSSTSDRTASSLSISGLLPDTTYHLRLAALHPGATLYAPALSARTSSEPAPIPQPSDIRMVLLSPEPGERVSGNRVLVLAEPIQAGAKLRLARFQHRRGDGSWADIPSVGAMAPNPAAKPPYWTFWDLTDASAYPDGDYELRSLPEGLSGEGDPTPPIVRVRVDRSAAESVGSGAGLWIQARRLLSEATSAQIRLMDPVLGVLTSALIPAGALADPSDAVLIRAGGFPVPPSPELESAGVVRDISLESGRTRLAQGRTATIAMQYRDDDEDGYVDGTSIRAERLRAYSYDPASGEWLADIAGSVDASRKTVTAETPHFSLFGLFAPAAADLSSVRVYPVPFVPNDGAADNGKPYSPSDATSGILFDSLTPGAEVKVYTVAGELVWQGAAGANGLLRWDARTRAGRDAASGTYFAVIRSGSGESAARALAIVR